MATETKKYSCPAEGCEYSGTENSVAAHYSGTRKQPDHAGGYEKAKQRMGSGTSKKEAETESGTAESSDGGNDGDTDSSTSETGSHPTFGDGTGGSDSGSSEPEEVDLPCGCESFDKSNCPEPPFWVSCDTCGKAYKVTEL